MPLAALAVLAKASSSSKSGSGGSSIFFILILVLAGVYFVVLRPRNKRMRQQTQSRNQVSVGDEVVTSGGLLGTVEDVSGDIVTVDCGGTVLQVWKRSVNLRSAIPGAPASLEPPADAEGLPHPDDDYGADDSYDDNYDEEPPGDEPGGPHPADDADEGADGPPGDQARPAGASGDAGDRPGGPGEGH